MSDLELPRPIWFRGSDRSEASMNAFYRFGGESNTVPPQIAHLDALAKTIVEPAQGL